RSASGVACGKMYSFPPSVSISTNCVIATSPICHFMRHLPSARMQVLRKRTILSNCPPRFPASTGLASKNYPPVLILLRADPAVHDKVKNHRIWLLPVVIIYSWIFQIKRQGVAKLPPYCTRNWERGLVCSVWRIIFGNLPIVELGGCDASCRHHSFDFRDLCGVCAPGGRGRLRYPG